MSEVKRFMISRYDETMKEPPYKTLKIDEMLVVKPEKDILGEEFCERIRKSLVQRGYKFKFYTSSEIKEYDFNAIVV